MKRQAGISLAEVLIGLTMVGITIMASLTVVSGALTSTRNNMDKQFATQKAVQMLEELRALVQAVQNQNATVLDDYDNGVSTLPELTTQRIDDGTGTFVFPPPDAEISGNKRVNGEWLYARHITVQRLPSIQSNDVRLVRVQVYKNDPSGRRLLAEVASVLSAVASPMPPTQVYDVYALAVENVPGWWVYMSNLIPFVEGAVQDLQARNPGLEYRMHWITKLAYGRDREYTPYINTSAPSTDDINWVYFYPGKMPTGSADDYYYPPDYFKARMNFDGTVRNGLNEDTTSPSYNPHPYALADVYNHAMRYPEEAGLFASRVESGQEDASTPTLRLLLEGMYTRPNDYRNAIIINLHGELFPFPPLRNFSDAAKDPQTYPGVRVVTHPEQMYYRDTSNTSENIKLRVYAYKMDPAVGANKLARDIPISIVLRNISWTPTAGAIRRIVGGLDSDDEAGIDIYREDNAPSSVGSFPDRMYYTTSTFFEAGETHTLIKLFNTPLTTPCVERNSLSATVGVVHNDFCSGGGLLHLDDNVSRRLYGLEYIPSPLEDLTIAELAPVSGQMYRTPAFTTNLTAVGDGEKNTARWIITIPEAVLPTNEMITVETRIDDDLTTGQLYPTRNDPTNLSTTYTWRGTDVWAFGNSTTAGSLPYTERFQIMGDPRHVPYSDLKRPHVGTYTNANQKGNESLLGLGYNPHFDDFEAKDFLDAEPADGTDSTTRMNWNGMAAEVFTTRELGSVAINNANRNCYVKINGGTEFTVQLTTGTRTLTQIVADFNNHNTFNDNAWAMVYGSRIRLATFSGGPNVSLEVSGITGGGGNRCNAVLGFGDYDTSNDDNVVGTGVVRARQWPGWRYAAADGNTYGIRNDDNVDNDGFRTSDQIEINMTRIFQMLRHPMQRSNALWTTMTGWSYYYIGVGNEIGYDDANGFPDSIQVSGKPFGYTGSASEQSIITSSCDYGCGVKYIEEDVASGWWGMNWLGELYPDDMLDRSGTNDWLAQGNLPTGTGAHTFRRLIRDQIPSTLYSSYNMAGTELQAAVRRTWEVGSVSFFWSGTTSATFQHTSLDTGVSNRQTPGDEIETRYAMPVPMTIASSRPFGLARGGNTPDYFLFSGYGSTNAAGYLSKFFQLSTDTARDGSSLVAVTDRGNNANAMFVVANGLSPTGSSGTAFIARWSMLTLIHSYFIGGQYSYTGGSATTDGTTSITGTPSAYRIKQVPQVRITNPNLQTQLQDPTSVNVTWASQWRRWDGQAYTASYNASALAQDATISLRYVVLYSRDNGRTWLHIQDDTEAQAGVKPTNTAYLINGTSYSWNVADTTSFPQGNYVLRVEAYREGLPLHYAYHQFVAFLDRT